ncbi:electron transport complex subunit RsxD [Neptunicella marina]|uniref:Ion-translocating oxidoreductase complex subunit D n=1 Tax=Neptunicella marina TaxID=2125989 RepID=A0A8J6IWT6_9ALTE|nr:electron transport complex subunit RsxD [Neptunicella marina]MBC3766813.1 electron transport complex subunit RsxD [Neptunicella marina]
MSFKLASSPHQHSQRNTAQLMRLVIWCALPGLLVQSWLFGWGSLIHFALATVTAVVTEVIILEVRKRNFEVAIKDSSAILTALLLAVSIPPFAPWWISVIGAFFAIAIVKQLYGGLGFNLFNPAMAAYVVLLISFPVQMTAWLPPASIALHSADFLDSLSMIFTQYSREGYSLAQLQAGIDGHTMATPLDQLKTDLTLGMTYSESLNNAIFDNGLGIGWLWVNMAYLAGGLVLLKQKAINWHIPVSLLLSLAVMATLFHLVDGDRFASATFHLFSGGIMLGAFFIATDPVSAATTNKGRLIFGAAIGFWIYLIRIFGGYPDAIAFSVLIMNMAVPLIDYYFRPRTYGHGRSAR